MRPLLLFAVAVGVGAVGAASTTNPSPSQLPASWAPADTADSLWRQGRHAIADEDWDRAIELFHRIRSRFPSSAYVGDSYYWEAYATYQKGGNSSLRAAVALLDTQRRTNPDAQTVKDGDAKSLATRIRGMLAQRGDAAAAADIARSAADAGRSADAVRASGAGRGRATTQESSKCKDDEDDD